MDENDNDGRAVKNEAGNILDDAKRIIEDARASAYRAVNTAMIQRNWLLGKRIVEEELCGGNKANYGTDVINRLAQELTDIYGKGYSARNLYNFTQFYKAYPEISQALPAKSFSPLSWTHYVTLLQVQDKKARDWYLKEASKQSWGYRTLERNIESQYYYRLLSTQNPDTVEQEAKDNRIDRLEFIKNPVIAEFLGFDHNIGFSESDLEESIIQNMQKFLMEIGKGYSFIARQQRIQTGNRNYFIDLVFYNTYLKCYVLIDLKATKITNRDVGQMDMYVRMYDKFKRTDGENPTLGIVLCSDTDEDVAHYSVLQGNEQLFATKYMMYLPSKEELRAEIESQKKLFYLQQYAEGSE